MSDMLNLSPSEEGFDIASGFIMKLLDTLEDSGFVEVESDGLREIDGLLVGSEDGLFDGEDDGLVVGCELGREDG
jgi:hypothetical protein